MQKSKRQQAQPGLSCILVTISALYNTSNVASFTADCNTITLVTTLCLISKMRLKTGSTNNFTVVTDTDVVPTPKSHYLASVSDNEVIPNLKIGSISRNNI